MSWAEWAGATFPPENDVRGDTVRTIHVGSWAEFFGAVFPHPDIVVVRPIDVLEVVSDGILVVSDGIQVVSTEP